MDRARSAFVPAALLVLALAPLPYGYYMLLRVVVTGWALYLAWTEYARRGAVDRWTAAFIAAALLFNPFAPAHLYRSTWAIFDLIGAVAFAWYGVQGGLERRRGGRPIKPDQGG